MYPQAAASALRTRWQCRSEEIDTLAHLLNNKVVISRCVHVFGRNATGKTDIVRDVLSSLGTPHSYVDLSNGYSDRAIFTQLADDLLPYFGATPQDDNVCSPSSGSVRVYAPAISNVQELVSLLTAVREDSAAAAAADATSLSQPTAALPFERFPFYIVIDDAQHLRPLPGTLNSAAAAHRVSASVGSLLGSPLAQLARLGDVLAAPIAVVLITRGVWPSLPEDVGMEVTHVHFRAYSEPQLTDILTRTLLRQDPLVPLAAPPPAMADALLKLLLRLPAPGPAAPLPPHGFALHVDTDAGASSSPTAAATEAETATLQLHVLAPPCGAAARLSALLSQPALRSFVQHVVTSCYHCCNDLAELTFTARSLLPVLAAGVYAHAWVLARAGPRAAAAETVAGTCSGGDAASAEELAAGAMTDTEAATAARTDMSAVAAPTPLSQLLPARAFPPSLWAPLQSFVHQAVESLYQHELLLRDALSLYDLPPAVVAAALRPPLADARTGSTASTGAGADAAAGAGVGVRGQHGGTGPDWLCRLAEVTGAAVTDFGALSSAAASAMGPAGSVAAGAAGQPLLPAPMRAPTSTLVPLLSLPVISQYLIFAAALAGLIPAKEDKSVFQLLGSGAHASPRHRRRAGVDRRATRVTVLTAALLGPKPFPVERLFTVFGSISENVSVVNQAVTFAGQSHAMAAAAASAAQTGILRQTPASPFSVTSYFEAAPSASAGAGAGPPSPYPLTPVSGTRRAALLTDGPNPGSAGFGNGSGGFDIASSLLDFGVAPLIPFGLRGKPLTAPQGQSLNTGLGALSYAHTGVVSTATARVNPNQARGALAAHPGLPWTSLAARLRGLVGLKLLLRSDAGRSDAIEDWRLVCGLALEEVKVLASHLQFPLDHYLNETA